LLETFLEDFRHESCDETLLEAIELTLLETCSVEEVTTSDEVTKLLTFAVFLPLQAVDNITININPA
jgi:hypothetical protein